MTNKTPNIAEKHHKITKP